MQTLNFSSMKPGTLIGYRFESKEGIHFGRFRKYEQVYSLVTIETIPAYKKSSELVTVNEEFVEKASTKPTPLTHFKAAIAEADRKEQAEAEAALALMAEKKAAKAAPINPVEVLAAADRRKAAAAQAWVTIRARRAAQAVA